MLEDDIELSQLASSYLELCLNTLNGRSNVSLIGCSLYKPVVNELSYKSISDWRPIRFNPNAFIKDERQPYMAFQLPSSWGSVYSGLSWAKLQTYYQLRQLHTHITDVVPDTRSNDWGKSWKRY